MIVKPLQLGILTRAYSEPPKAYYFVGATGYFDLLDPNDFDLDTAMWPAVAGILGSQPLDTAMPKPSGEVLLAGDAAAPGGNPVTQKIVEFSVGSVKKRLAVFGDRYWRLTQDGAVFTRPEPFVGMPVDWRTAFGGAGNDRNPIGKGHGASATIRSGGSAPLPNVEDPASLILSIDDSPSPAGCGPMDFMDPDRQRLLGTHDEKWLRTRHPGHAYDFNWDFYHAAPRDQWIDGFFRGDERITISGMHADHPVIESRLPGMRARAFVNMEVDGKRVLSELPMRLETVWLFPSILKGVCIYRGGQEIHDIDGNDVIDVMLAYERLSDEPRSEAHYVEAHRFRTDPESMGFAVFSTMALRPDVPEVEQEEREAARAEYTEQVMEKSQKQYEYTILTMLKKVGAPPPPPGSLPKLPPPPVKIPFATPGDIERLDVDMAGFMASMRELMDYSAAKLAEMKQRMDGELNAWLDVVDQQAGGYLGEASKAKLTGLKVPNIPQVPLPGGAVAAIPSIENLEAEADEIGGQGNFEKLLEALDESGEVPTVPAGDTDAQKILVRAKALGLPEGRMLAPAIAEISDMDLVEMAGSGAGDETGSDIANLLGPAAEPSAPGPTPAEEVENFLNELNLDPNSAELTPDLKATLSDMEAQAPIVASMMQIELPEQAKSPVEAKEEALATLEEKADTMEEGIAAARRISIEPTAPFEPLTEEAALYLGEIIQSEVAAGNALTGRDLAGANLEGAILSGADFTGALMEKVNLRGARLNGANLESVTLAGADLTDCDMSGTNLTKANLSKVTATGAGLKGVRLSESILYEGDFTGADFSGATMQEMIVMKGCFEEARFDAAEAERMIFMQSSMAKVRLDNARFNKIVFMEVDLTAFSGRGLTLFKCGFLACQAQDADCTGADLSQFACLGGTKMDRSTFRDMVAVKSGWHGASLVEADFHAARLDKSEMGEADLTDALLTRASFKRAMLNATVLTRVDATAANFFDAMLRRAVLTDASYRHTNLYGAALDDAILQNCDFTGANLTKTVLARAGNVA
jgi:uncharacterized protein YjbI with pentapeptide repeats